MGRAGALCSVVPDLDVLGFRLGIHYGDFWDTGDLPTPFSSPRSWLLRSRSWLFGACPVQASSGFGATSFWSRRAMVCWTLWQTEASALRSFRRLAMTATFCRGGRYECHPSASEDSLRSVAGQSCRV